jgi:hypothetical protein
MSTPASSLIRPLSGIIAATFIAATVLSFGLEFGLFVRAPDLPETNDLVQNLLGGIDFQHAAWPFDLAANLLFAVGLVAMVPFGRVLAALAPGDDWRTTLFSSALLVGGALGAGAQLIYIGAKQTTIDTPYCDCGYKVQESISQFWALMLINGAHDWLINGVAVLLALGVVLAGAVLVGRLMPTLWGALSWVTAAFALAGLLLQIGHFGPIGPLVSAISTAVLLPAWVVWLGVRIGGRGPAPTVPALPDTEPVDVE